MTALDPICEIFSLRLERGLSLSGQSTLHLSNSYYKDKYKILRDTKGRSIGYIVWAEISSESCFRLINHGYFPRYHYEWDEGKICLILDVVFGVYNPYEARGIFLDFVRSFDVVAFKRKSFPKIYRKCGGRFYKITGFDCVLV